MTAIGASFRDPALLGRADSTSLSGSVQTNSIQVEIGVAQGISGPPGPTGPAVSPPFDPNSLGLRGPSRDRSTLSGEAR